MKHTARIELVNNDELVLANAGVMPAEDVKRITVEDALVDTGATRLGLPPSLIEQLGLTPFRSEPVRTVNGITELWIYSPVQFTLLERESITTVMGVPDGTSVLIGHLLLEDLDLCLDMKKGLIYNPAHDGEWMSELYCLMQG